ncbi:hypothetical protein [Nonomuraea maheshkhaliensis]|uniref:hypothetical protein n=1 Tax=Nonomuraea maheshkhaliensis TaxID=419590 RepID=UPI0031F81176
MSGSTRARPLAIERLVAKKVAYFSSRCSGGTLIAWVDSHEEISGTLTSSARRSWAWAIRRPGQCFSRSSRRRSASAACAESSPLMP